MGFLEYVLHLQQNYGVCKVTRYIKQTVNRCLNLACFSSEVEPPTKEPSAFGELASSKGIDPTSPYVFFEGKVCPTHKEAKTNLLDYLNRSDIFKRQTNADIPFFTAGSYVSVTKSDPYSPSGETRFAGICISRRKINQPGSTFILRNVLNGIAVEMMYELYSPAIKEIKVLKLERRRRAKLYYLRDKPPKYSTINERMEPIPTVAGVVPVHRRKGAPA